MHCIKITNVFCFDKDKARLKKGFSELQLVDMMCPSVVYDTVNSRGVTI